MREYATMKINWINSAKCHDFCSAHSLEGLEIYMDDVKSRNTILFKNIEEKNQLIQRLKDFCVKRIHGSYWAYPTAFLDKQNFAELVERLGGEIEAKNYYGDLTGKHICNRWCQEYEIAAALGSQAYVFHLIDYAPIDGMWEFTISKSNIRQAMISMLQAFINELLDRNLLSASSPVIETENAGWGLEHGIQSADDYDVMFSQLYDPYDKVRIGWDINHLLHAVGYDRTSNIAKFFLPVDEITKPMKQLQENYSDHSRLLAEKWLEYNLLDRRTSDRISSIHLSDCALKEISYFNNGMLTGEFLNFMKKLDSWEDKENYGVDIVLSKYDSHLVLGTGTIDTAAFSQTISELLRKNKNMVILHELKNSKNINEDLTIQQKALKNNN